MTGTLAIIADEATRAQARYGDYASTHEAVGVLLEEVAELRDAVRANDLAAVGTEAVQVAAVALRLADLCLAGPATPFARRSVP